MRDVGTLTIEAISQSARSGRALRAHESPNRPLTQACSAMGLSSQGGHAIMSFIIRLSRELLAKTDARRPLDLDQRRGGMSYIVVGCTKVEWLLRGILS